MVEIVFSESACGSLKQAQSFGIGKYRGRSVGVFFSVDHPSPDEITNAARRAEEQARRDWKQAIPLGGKPTDVHCIDLAWSVGEISDNMIGEQRRETLKRLRAVWPVGDIDSQIEETLRVSSDALSTVLNRCASGECIRIWYSHNPNELCGMYWLMTHLHGLKSRGEIRAVKLPVWEYSGEASITMRTGWGEIGPGEWGWYLSRQEIIQPAFLSTCAMKWRQLQEENTPLRILLNGHLQSAPADIYDSFILREIAAQPGEFWESHVIGNVIGKYQLGIGDAWISLRIEEMIKEGLLHIVREAPASDPVYRRILGK